MNEHLSRSLERYIREIDIIILGIGILLFVTGEHSHFSAKLFNEKQLILIDVIFFVSVYVFLTYDWIAYTTLIFKYPYRVDSIIRLYIDLFQLFLKALLVYLVTLEITIWHLLLASILFVIWHSVILLWHSRARKEHTGIPPMGLNHWLYLFFYLIYAGVTFYFASRCNWEANELVRYSWTVVLCVMMVGISVFRQRFFLAMASSGAASPPVSVGEFEAQVARLRAVLEANIAARCRIEELNDLVNKTQTTIADLERKLSP